MTESKPDLPNTAAVVGKSLAQGSLIGVQAGCVSVLLVIVALVAGLLLDRALGTRYIFTLGLLLLSVPVSLTAMVYTVLRSSRSLRADTSTDKTRKEDGTLE
jgi:F0F1-type ATP synthase assembly protein I